MPKVTEEYIRRKRTEILDAAYTVFQKKPLYEINMLDVITQAGLSKGGIYRYYKDIDYVIVELINREVGKFDFKREIDEVLAREKILFNRIESLINLLGKHINESSRSIGKIQFELTVLQANHPERAQKIVEELEEHTNGQYLITALFDMLEEGIAEDIFTPQMSLTDIFNHIHITIEGLVKIVVLESCYGDKSSNINPEHAMLILNQTLKYMLGVI